LFKDAKTVREKLSGASNILDCFLGLSTMIAWLRIGVRVKLVQLETSGHEDSEYVKKIIF
jgi:hypothetical protein